MIDRLTASFDFHAAALKLRSERTRVLAANIANADTPHYKARDIDFRSALLAAVGEQSARAAVQPARTSASHLSGSGGVAGAPTLLYRTPLQTALDGNTVELERERANFAENIVRYEASLRFLNGQIRTLLAAIKGE